MVIYKKDDEVVEKHYSQYSINYAGAEEYSLHNVIDIHNFKIYHKFFSIKSLSILT
jgi:hypothetical protein